MLVSNASATATALALETMLEPGSEVGVQLVSLHASVAFPLVGDASSNIWHVKLQ